MIRLITGGARSGKSSFAESLFKDKKNVVYIATSTITDQEMEERVKLHREARPVGWRTYEASLLLTPAIGEEENYLLDCITTYISNIMFEMTVDMEYIDYKAQAKIEKRVYEELYSLIEEINQKNYNLNIVTNELGNSIVPENHLARVFRDIQGRINQRLGEVANEVYLVVCGIPVKIK